MEKKVLFNFLEFPGISGKEQYFLNLISEKARKLSLDYQYDNLGSLTIIKKSKNKNSKKVMIDAHVDQVGFEVIGINDKGLLEIDQKGYLLNKVSYMQRVRVWNDSMDNYLSGVVVAKELDLLNSSIIKSEIPEVDNLVVDLGFSSKKEAVDQGIKIGNVITFDTKPSLNGDLIISQAIDNRLGAYLLYKNLDFINEEEFEYDLFITFSTQEEVGLRGSRTSTFKYEPDLGIVIDISPTNDYNDAKFIRGEIGKGTILRFKDGTTIYPQTLTTYLKSLLEKNQIKYQPYFGVGGTNAGIMHLINQGRLVIPLGLLARNLHTSSSIVNLKDFEETEKFLRILLKDLNNTKINSLKQLGD